MFPQTISNQNIYFDQICSIWFWILFQSYKSSMANRRRNIFTKRMGLFLSKQIVVLFHPFLLSKLKFSAICCLRISIFKEKTWILFDLVLGKNNKKLYFLSHNLDPVHLACMKYIVMFSKLFRSSQTLPHKKEKNPNKFCIFFSPMQ